MWVCIFSLKGAQEQPKFPDPHSLNLSLTRTVLSDDSILNSAFIVFQVIFEAIRGVSIRSDIAIDDVKFQAGPCAGNSIFPNLSLIGMGFYSSLNW